MIDNGLQFLARKQSRAGFWQAGQYTTSVTALCGLAFVAGGNTLTTGKYAENVSRAVDWVLRWQGTDPNWPGLIASLGEDRHMYGHGFATMFLAEVYGQGGQARQLQRLREALVLAVKVMEGTQSDDGGWYYWANSRSDEGSVTITQVQALRAARNAGIPVPAEVIEGAVQYIRDSQDRGTGGIRYRVNYGNASPALTGAGLAVLYQAGDYGSEEIELALDYMQANHVNQKFSLSTHFLYTNFYAAQAYHQAEVHSTGGIRMWRTYFPRIREQLRDVHNKALGSWDISYGPYYSTALALLILQIPLRYLPTYER